MTFTRVQSVRVADKSADYLLLNVSADSQDASTLNLSATEGDDAYAIQLHKSDIDKSRLSSSKVSTEEWRTIVDWLLLHKSPPPNFANLVNQTELVCSVETSKAVTLLIRQNIGGITHRLGSIQLKVDTEVGIVPAECAIIAADDRDRVEREIVDLQGRYDEQQTIINKLNTQLAELIEAKKAHEDELLEKFRHLLNSKKAKIRDQMRLLATVDVDRATAEKVFKDHGGERSPPTNGTRAKTKKRGQKRTIDEDEEMETEEEPKMANEDPDSDRDGTPEQNDDTTDEESPMEQPSSSKSRNTVSPPQSQPKKATPPSTSSQSQKSTSKPVSQARSSQTSKSSQPIPKKAHNTRAAKTINDDDSDSEAFESATVNSQPARRRAAATSAATPASQIKASTQSMSPPPRRELPFRKAANAASPAPASQTKKAPVKQVLADDEDTADEDDDFGEL